MADKVIFVCILVLAAAYAWATEQLPSLEIGDPLGPKAFPRLLTVGLVICAVVLLLEIIRGRKPAAPGAVSMSPGASRTGVFKIVAGVTVWTFLFFLAFEWLGYVLATSIYLLAMFLYFHPGKWKTNVLTALGFAAGSYFMFVHLLGVNLAPGLLPF